MAKTFAYDSRGYEIAARERFAGTAGIDTLVAVFGTDGTQPASRVTTVFTANADGSFTATYRNALAGELFDAVTITGIENVHIRTPDRYTTTEGNTYDLNTADEIRTGGGDDVIRTFGGDDLVDTGAGTDDADGGRGVDGIAADLGAASGAIGWDLGSGGYSGPGRFAGFEYFTGLRTGSGHDRIVTGTARIGGRMLADTIDTGAGDDRVTLFGGRDTVALGAGNDRLVIDYGDNGDASGAIRMTLRSGNSGYAGTLFARTSENVAFSGVEHFTIRAIDLAEKDDDIVTGRGNDEVLARNGDDRVDVGTGRDTVDGGDGIDGIAKDFSAENGDIGWDLTKGRFSGADGSFANLEWFVALETGAGDDRIVTGTIAADDLVSSGAGDDRATFFAGDDRFRAGSGDDRLVIDYRDNAAADGRLVLRLDAGTSGYDGAFGARGTSERVQFSGVEAFTITGASRFDFDDMIVAGAGDDQLALFGGDDRLDGGAGADTLIGGLGDDSYVIDSTVDVIRESRGEGTDTVIASISYGLDGLSVENLLLTGRAKLSGTGNDAANLLIGNDGANNLGGGRGDDTIDGGGGQDVMTGGAGADLFRFAPGGFGGRTARTADTILDFSQRGHDRIDLSAVDADAGTARDDRFTLIGAGAFTGRAGELRDFIRDGSTFVEGDTNGDGRSDFQIRLLGAVDLGTADFVL